MELNPASARFSGRWAAGLIADVAGRSAREELAGTFWYPVYACLRAGGRDPEEAARRTESALTCFIEEPAPDAPLLRERLLAIAREAAENAPVPGILAIDHEWAASRFAEEAPRTPDETFARRWTLGLIESTLATLEAEYASRAPAFTAMQPFLGYSGGAEGEGGSYAELAAKLGSTDGGARKAVFDLRTRYRDLLRAVVADTVAREDQIDSELSALLIELPPPAASVAPRSVLRRVNPEELLARAMHTARVSSAGAHGWMPPTVEEVAQLLPQYDIVAMLGHGGMGAVYQGRQRELDRLVAIKLLPLEISEERDFADRFRREARAMARLEHPHIIAVHDFGQTSEGHLYFVMDFVNGATLHAKIHREKLPPDEALGIIAQVCDALAYAHEEGVIHRDIKPANVMVDQRGRVKVADFGLARLTGGAAPESGLTQLGTVMGTPDYMAPEQRRGMDVDHRADIYSTGVMLYEALTGEVPHGMFKAASQKAAGVDPRIDQVIGRALRPDPEERYQTSGEMRAALEVIRSTPLPVAVASPLGAGKVATSGAASSGKKAAVSASGKKPNPALLYGGIATGVLVLAAVAFAFLPKKEELTKAQQSAAQRAAEAQALSGRVGVPPAGEGVSPSRTFAPPKNRSGETPQPAGGTPTLPETPTEGATANQPSAPAASPAAIPREWLISKTANVPPPAAALEFQKSKYQYLPGAIPWPEAKARAEAMGGHLATVTTQEEHEWIARTFGSLLSGDNTRFWIGGIGEGRDGTWRWITGELFSFVTWARGEPNFTDSKGSTSSNPSAISLHRGRGASSLIAWNECPTQWTTGLGYLVEWDRFSAADAAANDPAKWKDWLADARQQGSTTFSGRKLDKEGVHVALGESLNYSTRQTQFTNGAVRVRFTGEKARINLGGRSAESPDRKTLRSYSASFDGEQVSLSLHTYDLVQKKSKGAVTLAPTITVPTNGSSTHTFELRVIDDLLTVYVDSHLVQSARDATLKEGWMGINNGSGTVPFLLTEFSTLTFDSSQSSEPKIAAAPTPTPATLAPMTPKPLTEMEKWLAQVEGPQQESFARDVVKPFETAVADLKKGYVAALDTRVAAASKAGLLEDALGWRTERQRFAEGGAGMPADDTDLAALASKPVATALPPLRTQFRTHLAKLEADRAARARTAFTRFDAILTPAITQLTQRDRLDDALLLKTKLDAVRTAWLGATSATLAVGTPARPTGGTPALQPGAAPKPDAAAAPIPAGPRLILKKYPKGDDRKAAEWVLGLGGDVTVRSVGGSQTKVTKVEDLPRGRFALVEVRLHFSSGSARPIASLEPLAGLEELYAISTDYVRITDEQLAPLASLPKLTNLSMERAALTDDAVGYAIVMPALAKFAVQNNHAFTGVRLGELVTTPVTSISLLGCGLVDGAFPALAQLKALQTLSLKTTSTTDSDLAVLWPLSKLQGFSLSPSKVTLAGIRGGPSLLNLERLGWNFTPGGAAEELNEVARLCPKLTSYALEVDGTTLIYAESDIAALAALRGLVELNVSGKSFSDGAARGILALKSLQKLSLGRSTVTDATLGTLAEHRSLESIGCDSPEITDAGLIKLAAMKQLKKLEVTRAQRLTPAGFAAFAKARPDVTLVR